jgi:hypothetical protein
MAVAVRASSTPTSSATTTLVVNVPAGVQNGDTLIMLVVVAGAAHTPTQASWTQLDAGTTGPSVATFWRIAASEPGSYNVTIPATNNSTGVMIAYSGAHATTPINQHGALNRTTVTPVTATTITPSVDNCMILFACGEGSTAAITTPAGYNSEQNGLGGGSLLVVLADLLQTTATATGSVTGAIAGSQNAYSGLIAIAPPAAGGTTYTKTGFAWLT